MSPSLSTSVNVQRQPDKALGAFNSFTIAKRWKKAARFGLVLVEQSAADSLSWSRMAPVLALADDEDACRNFCRRMSQQFSQTENTQATAHICKAGLLLPVGLELANLSAKRLDFTKRRNDPWPVRRLSLVSDSEG